MPIGLPELIDPLVFSEQGRELNGTLAMARMTRLRAALLEPVNDVGIKLEFSVAGRGLRVITGQIEALGFVECQRCLLAMELELGGDVCLRLVADESAAKLLTDEWDPLIYTEGESLSLVQLVEDELLVGLPHIFLHDPSECQPLIDNGEQQKPAEKILDSPSPFSLLAKLKERTKD